MNWSEANTAFEDAKRTLNRADDVATNLARILVGRLRKVYSDSALADLKRELKDFNIHTSTWK